MNETNFTTRIVGIKFRNFGRIYDYDARDFKFSRGDYVICDLEDKGPMVGQVSKPIVAIPEGFLKIKLPPITRPASAPDVDKRKGQEEQERKGLQYAREVAERGNLKIHVLSVEIPFNTKKVMVYFSSPDRVDFKDLLRDLSGYFKTRVEIKQLASRDETKYVGGIGPCGQETCCSRFLHGFHAVTIKMAKDQGLSLNPTKVSGNCGRLKCCLAYEQPIYAEARKTLPKLGNCVKCASKSDGSGGGCGVVQKLDVLAQMVLVRFEDGTVENVPAHRILEKSTITKHAAAAAKARPPSGGDESQSGENDENEDDKSLANLEDPA